MSHQWLKNTTSQLDVCLLEWPVSYLVSCFFIRGPISCSNNSKLLAVVCVKFRNRAQLSILTSLRMFSILFCLSRKFAVRFQLRFLLCAIMTAAAATAAHSSALEDKCPSQQRVNRKRHDATSACLLRFEACISTCNISCANARKEARLNVA